ncbi:MAG: hypothetical protein ACM37W_15875 [Actinomycetota bacterium]
MEICKLNASQLITIAGAIAPATLPCALEIFHPSCTAVKIAIEYQ